VGERPAQFENGSPSSSPVYAIVCEWQETDRTRAKRERGVEHERRPRRRGSAAIARSGRLKPPSSRRTSDSGRRGTLHRAASARLYEGWEERGMPLPGCWLVLASCCRADGSAAQPTSSSLLARSSMPASYSHLFSPPILPSEQGQVGTPSLTFGAQSDVLAHRSSTPGRSSPSPTSGRWRRRSAGPLLAPRGPDALADRSRRRGSRSEALSQMKTTASVSATWLASFETFLVSGRPAAAAAAPQARPLEGARQAPVRSSRPRRPHQPCLHLAMAVRAKARPVRWASERIPLRA
jgi:hypothetical protein